MKCCKCLQSQGQMICYECYKTIRILNNQKKNVIASKRLTSVEQLKALNGLRQSFVGKLQIKKKKAVLMAQIRQLKNKNRAVQQKNKEKEDKCSLIQVQIQALGKQLDLIDIRKKQIEEQIVKTKNRVNAAIKEKEKLKGQTMKIMQSKFKQIIKYISFDEIQPLQESDWNQFVKEEGLESLQTTNENTQRQELSQLPSETTNIVSILEDTNKQKRIMVRHFQKSIKVVKILSQLYSVELPYRISAAQFKSKISLKSALFNESNGKKFNYSLLKRHQANTIYLYSRACMTVFHPDIEQGRLQELHETMINRLRGYTLRPISFQIRKAASMSQLSTESLIHYCQFNKSEKEQEQVVESGYLGFFQCKIEADGEDQDAIQLLI